MSKLWIISDLHIDLSGGWELPSPGERPEYDILVVAGDLTSRMDRGVRWLLQRVKDKPVVYIAGNHEGYGEDIDGTIEKARMAARDTNVSVLENDVAIIGGCRIVASTLWTDFDLFGSRDDCMFVAAKRMNDYRWIVAGNYSRRLEPQDTLERHFRSRAFVEAQLSQPFAGPTIVVTHHAPYREAVPHRFGSDLTSASYASDLEDLIVRFQPDVWIHGHIHESQDRTFGGTRLIANPKGYGPAHRGGVQENQRFDPLLVIEIAAGENP